MYQPCQNIRKQQKRNGEDHPIFRDRNSTELKPPTWQLLVRSPGKKVRPLVANRHEHSKPTDATWKQRCELHRCSNTFFFQNKLLHGIIMYHCYHCSHHPNQYRCGHSKTTSSLLLYCHYGIYGQGKAVTPPLSR